MSWNSNVTTKIKCWKKPCGKVRGFCCCCSNSWRLFFIFDGASLVIVISLRQRWNTQRWAPQSKRTVAINLQSLSITQNNRSLLNFFLHFPQFMQRIGILQHLTASSFPLGALNVNKLAIFSSWKQRKKNANDSRVDLFIYFLNNSRWANYFSLFRS